MLGIVTEFVILQDKMVIEYDVDSCYLTFLHSDLGLH